MANAVVVTDETIDSVLVSIEVADAVVVFNAVDIAMVVVATGVAVAEVGVAAIIDDNKDSTLDSAEANVGKTCWAAEMAADA